MDIEILLFLQNLRNSLGGVFNEFFTVLTNVAVDYYIILIPLIIYWTCDKKKGMFIYLSYGLSCLLNALAKSIFCIYRPWIRDQRVKPLDSAIDGATGFSFPSGHSTSASSIYYPLIKIYKNHKLTIFCVVMIVLTMFSRIFAGVHTPQDVLVGLLLGITSAYIVSAFSKYLEKNPNKDTLVLVVSVLVIVATILYVGLKSYPMDYVDGKLLVDPELMKINSFKDPGKFFGLLIAWYLDRKYFKYEVSGTISEKVLRAIVGALLVIAYYAIVVNAIGKIINNNLVHFLLNATTSLIFINLYPLFWKKK